MGPWTCSHSNTMGANSNYMLYRKADPMAINSIYIFLCSTCSKRSCFMSPAGGALFSLLPCAVNFKHSKGLLVSLCPSPWGAYVAFIYSLSSAAVSILWRILLWSFEHARLPLTGQQTITRRYAYDRIQNQLSSASVKERKEQDTALLIDVLLSSRSRKIITKVQWRNCLSDHSDYLVTVVYIDTILLLRFWWSKPSSSGNCPWNSKRIRSCQDLWRRLEIWSEKKLHPWVPYNSPQFYLVFLIAKDTTYNPDYVFCHQCVFDKFCFHVERFIRLRSVVDHLHMLY